MRSQRTILSLSLGVLLGLGVSSCATLQQIAALRNVEFSLDRVSDLRLAGIDLGRIHSFEDLGILDAGRMALAVSQKRRRRPPSPGTAHGCSHHHQSEPCGLL